MSYFHSKCLKIRVLVKTSYKRLKVNLALRIKKLNLVSLVLILGKFLYFDNLDLSVFQRFI